MDDLIDDGARAAFAHAFVGDPAREELRIEHDSRDDAIRERFAGTVEHLHPDPCPACGDTLHPRSGECARCDEGAEVPDRGQLASAEAVRRYVLGGHGILTLVSRATGRRFTFRLGSPRSDDATDPATPLFVGLLSGPQNTRDYTFLGTLFRAPSFRHGRRYSPAYRHGTRSKISTAAGSARAATWFFGRVLAGGEPLDVALRQMEVWHEGCCGQCGRRLTVPESIESGIGPVCAGREAA